MDPKIPFLETALNPQEALPKLQRARPDIQRVKTATLIRHKPGRRALIAYELDTVKGPLTLLGKIRAKGTDLCSYNVQRSLWEQGFESTNPDGFSVPEPMGIIPDWRMWLQQKVSGVSTTELLPTDQGIFIAQRIAALAHKLHCTPIVSHKTHTLEDELRILHERLPVVSQQYPKWQPRITKLLKACDALASSLPPHAPQVGIHRDFYSDQILVEGDRFWLVDLDLYCQGHPALDIGNFIAHITEQSLRQMQDPTTMANQERALQDSFIEAVVTGAQPAGISTPLSGQDWRKAIQDYTLLSLVRHIHISTRIPDRNAYTERLISLCETHLRVV